MRCIITKISLLMVLVSLLIFQGCSTPPQKENNYEKIKKNADESIKELEHKQREMERE